MEYFSLIGSHVKKTASRPGVQSNDRVCVGDVHHPISHLRCSLQGLYCCPGLGVTLKDAAMKQHLLPDYFEPADLWNMDRSKRPALELTSNV